MSLPSGSLGATSPMAAMPSKSAHKRIFRALLSIASAALLVRAMGMLDQSSAAPALAFLFGYLRVLARRREGGGTGRENSPPASIAWKRGDNSHTSALQGVKPREKLDGLPVARVGGIYKRDGRLSIDRLGQLPSAIAMACL